jgi:hypothetical protein
MVPGTGAKEATLRNAAFYCMSSDIYFIGAVGMINSLRLQGHDQPVHVLDLGLEPWQRGLLAKQAEIVESPPGVPPWLLKTIAPLQSPAETMVLIDADMIVTRRLDELIERAAEGRVVAVEHGSDRHVPEWGEILDLGPIRRQTYVCSGLIFAGRDPGEEVLRLVADRQRHVEFERTSVAGYDRDYPLVYLDQDVLNAVLSSQVEADRVVILERRLEAIPPFDGLRVVDEGRLRCVYEDGAEPYAVHHFSAKPWLEFTPRGVYTQLLERLLLEDDVAIRVPAERLPLHFRRDPVSRVRTAAAVAGWRIRSRVTR